MSPKIRQALYTAGVVATSVLTILSALRLIDADTASALGAALATLLSLFGVAVTGTAAVKTGQQRKNGTFEQLSPADQVVNGVDALNAADQALQADKDRVRGALSQLIPADVPVLGPLAKQAAERIFR